jgi:hypothetical protein
MKIKFLMDFVILKLDIGFKNHYMKFLFTRGFCIQLTVLYFVDQSIVRNFILHEIL